MSDQPATPLVGIGTGRSLPCSPAPDPDRTQRGEILGQVSGGILHEFNNILTVISGTIDILAQAVTDRPELAAIIRLIDEAALRGARLTSHLIAFERGRPPQYSAVDVAALLSDTARLLRPVLGGRSDIAVTSSTDPMMAVVDPGLLMAAILKLAITARNAVPDGGRILMAAARAGASTRGGVVDEVIEITIDAVETDGCPGWSADDLDAIEELVRLSGGDIAIDRQVDHVGFDIRLRTSDAPG
jgi:signal transduction histidine kinase